MPRYGRFAPEAVSLVAGSGLEERESGGMLPGRKSLVPRKTFTGNLRSLASALPQVAENGNDASGLGRQLQGVRSYAPGSAADLSPLRAGGPLRDASEQLVEVSPAGRDPCLATTTA